MKNIPLPPKNSYLKRLIEKVESVIKRIRWKAFFFDQNSDDKEQVTDEKFGFKSRKCPPQNDEMDKFEADSTELSKFIWLLKDNNTDFKIKWSILTSAAAYCNKSKRCNLCLAEKFFIIKAEKSTLLNKRSELVSKCRHENKFYLMNLKADHT